MKDQDKSKQQLMAENEELRRRVAAMESTEAERSQAGEELRRSEAKWRSVVENAPLFVAVVDQSGKIQFLNRFQPGFTAETVVGRPVYDFLQPQYHADARKCLEHVFQTGERISYECAGARSDGSVSEYVTDIGPVIVEGEIIAATLISRDITDRKRAEEGLKKSEARFRSLFQDSAVGTTVVSPQGEFVQVNRAFCEFLGYSEQELAGKTVLSFTHPDDREASSKAIYQAAHSGPRIQRLEKRYLHKNGRVLWGEVSSNLILDAHGNPDYFITQVLDITERKQVEEALQRAHDKLEVRVKERTAELSATNEQLRIFRMFMEASGQGFGMAGLDGYITYWNPTLCRLFGEDKPEDVAGKHVSAYYPKEYLEKRRKEILPAVMRGGYWQGEVVLHSRHGKVTPILQNTFLIRDEKGHPLRLAAAITDITERKAAEEALERERQSLWRMLQASDHERQLIAYDIHDGLAQYLAAATMQFQVFDGLRDSNPEEAKQAYDAATQLVRQAHSEARRLISEVRPPVIDEIGLETAISHLVHEQRRHGGPKIKFDSEVQFARLPPILENSLYRIAQEALANACKHSKSKEVEVTLTQEGQEVRLKIQDWGIGFAPESVQEGRFGLEGIRQRVRLLGGRLNIESKPGSGTLVQVVVPVLEKQSEG